MTAPTTLPTQMLRTAIVQRLDDLCVELFNAARFDVANTGLGSNERGDRKDLAEYEQESTVAEASMQRDRVEASELRAALQRIDAGQYGNCVECGEPIPLQRLQAQPAALRCAACQAREERLLREHRAPQGRASTS